MICVAICIAYVLWNGSRYRGRDIVISVLCTDSCVQYEIDHVNRYYSSKLSRFCRHALVDNDHRANSFPELSKVFRSFTREISPRAFREWPIAIKRNKTAEKVKERKTEKKRGWRARSAAANSSRETIWERAREKKRIGEGEDRRREGERARASCRHLGLAFNLRASRRALIRAGSSSRYEPRLRYKQELEWVRRVVGVDGGGMFSF